MLKIRVPKSLVDEISRYLPKTVENSLLKDSRIEVIPPMKPKCVMRGPYGEYELVPVPDEEYCERKMIESFTYRDNTCKGCSGYGKIECEIGTEPCRYCGGKGVKF